MTIPTHSPTERGVWHYYSEAQNVICPKLLQQNSQFVVQGEVPTFAIAGMFLIYFYLLSLWQIILYAKNWISITFV